MKHLRKYLGLLLIMTAMVMVTACGDKSGVNESKAPESTLESISEAESPSETEKEVLAETESLVETETEVPETEASEPEASAQADDENIGQVVMPTTQVLNLRQKASSDSQILIRMTPQDLARILDVKGDWYRVNVLHVGKHYEGFVSKDYVKPCSTGELVADAAIYKEAKAAGKALVTLEAGDQVYIFDMKHDFYKVVADSDGEEYIGYIDKDSVEPDGELDLGKEIYLTFDDGPAQYTQELLDVLDKYDVKVTFFVTNQYPDYIDMIKKEADAGHTVAVHTYSHTYGKIYKSEDAYFADYDKMADLIEKQTGERPNIFRFPGGSSNTVSADVSKGIMTKLTKASEERGLVYSDWNVSSGDAGETTKTEEVYKNVIREVQMNGRIPSVVLQHDIKGFSVDAVEDIIKWGLDNGYTFKAMTETEGIVHHQVNN